MAAPHFFSQYIRTDQQGIEIGPWFNPVAPKVKGYNSLSLDVCDREALIARAKADPAIPAEALARIEPVDLVGTASDLGELARSHQLSGAVDYVIGSHVIEHIPDPVRFFQAVGDLLKPGGTLLLAVPDSRACFDYFRPHSTTADILAAYQEKRVRPTPHQVFSHQASVAEYRGQTAFSVDVDAAEVYCRPSLEGAYAAYRAACVTPPTRYVDAHCWVFVPASFELIVHELAYLNLIQLDVEFVTEPTGCEFYVKLNKSLHGGLSMDAFYKLRNRLLHAIHNQLAVRQTGRNNSVLEKMDAIIVSTLGDPEGADEIRQSEFFDASYYLSQNPDVAQSGMDPVVHYLKFGWTEGRNPHPRFDTRYYLDTNPDVAAAGVNPLLHYIRHGAAESRWTLPRPKGILDQYSSTAPSPQAAVDIFAGEWFSKLPGLSSGGAELFHDDRVIWGCNALGGVQGQRVLELGPLEGAHTYGLIRQMGCREVVAVEANSRAFLRCLIVKELYGLDAARFLYGDVVAYLEGSVDKFDLIFASGVLYHMREPLRLLKAIADHTDRCVLSTHYYDEAVIAERPVMRPLFSAAGTTSLGELSYPVWRFEYQEALKSPLFCGGSAPYSLWLDRASLLDALHKLGFTRIQVNHEQASPNGPIFTLALSKD